jgi:hypothetical protein
MSGIAPRVFLLRNVNDDAPILFRTRWALSWLRGPLTQPEIARLMADRRPAKAAEPAAASAPTAKPSARPSVPAGVQEFFLAAKPGSGELTYRPRVVATAELHFADKPAGIDSWTCNAWVAQLPDGDGAPSWTEAVAVPNLDAVSARRRSTVRLSRSFRPPPSPPRTMRNGARRSPLRCTRTAPLRSFRPGR